MQRVLSVLSPAADEYYHYDVLSTKELTAAEKELDCLLLNEPSNPEALRLRGNVLADQDRHQEAIEDFSRLLSLAERDSVGYAHLGLGNEYAKIGARDLAEEHYEAAVLAMPQYAPALANYAYLLEQVGDFRKSSDLYGKALQIDPELEFARDGLNRTGRRLRLDESIAAARNRLSISPNDVEQLLALAWMLAEQKSHIEARDIYQHVLEVDQANAEAMIGLRALDTAEKCTSPSGYLELTCLLPREEVAAYVSRIGSKGTRDVAEKGSSAALDAPADLRILALTSVYLQLCEEQIAADHVTEGRKYCEQALEMFPDSPTALEILRSIDAP